MGDSDELKQFRLRYEDDSLNESSVDNVCAYLKRHPQHLPRVCNQRGGNVKGRVRIKSSRPGLVFPLGKQRISGVKYYPALEEMPEEFPAELVTLTGGPEEVKEPATEFYKQHREAIHYSGFIYVVLDEHDDEEDVKEAIEAVVVWKTLSVWGEFGRACLLECLDKPPTDWSQLPQVDFHDWMHQASA